MQLLNIIEPGQNQELPEQKTIVIGIDLGTTNSLVAYAHDGKAEILPDVNGHYITPSIVTIDKEGNMLVENSPSKGQIISSVKRLMGMSSNEAASSNKILPSLKKYLIADEKVVRLEVGNKQITPVEFSAEILRKLKLDAENYFKEPVTKAVITVPAYFDEAARNATKDAAKLAGLEVLRLISEPTAAAYAYGLDNGAEGSFLVYDLGGGTFDVSLLKMRMGVFQVIATGGDPLLGGDDFDMLIAKHIEEQLLTIYNAQILETIDLVLIAKNLKEQLSDKDMATAQINIAGNDIEVSLDLPTLEAIIRPLLNKTIKIMQSVIEDSSYELEDIKGIILVGGSTRLKLIPKMLTELFSLKIYNNFNPDKVVALGAALQAENLSGGGKNLLLDVAPLSLGIEMMGGVVEKLITRNTAIPVSVAQEFTTYADNQTAMQFHIVQGDREFAKDCRSLAHFELLGIPPMKAGVARVQVQFSLDADGLLFISAKELSTNAHTEIAIKPSYGLDEGTIIEMLKSAMYNAHADHEARLLAETKTEAIAAINGIKAALKESSEILDIKDKQTIENKIKELQLELEKNNRDDILKAMDILEKATNSFFEEKMSTELKMGLKGTHID